MNKNLNKYIKNMLAITLVITCASTVTACSKKDDNSNLKDSAIEKQQDQEDENVEEATNKNDSNNVIAEKSGAIITLGDKAVEVFNENESGVNKYIETIANHKKALGKDIDVYNLIAPTHVEFSLPDKYKEMSTPQKPVIDKVYNKLGKDIKTVDAYNNLQKHKDEYIYFNTDHHWTSLGAYYAYEAFAKEAGFEAKDLKNYQKYTKKDFLGTLYTQTQDKNLKNNPDSVDYYKIPYDYQVYRYEKNDINKPLKSTLYADYATGTNAYSVFLHGDFPKIKIVNKDAESNKKIVVVKESYGNSFVPFLIPHYKEIIVVDSRQYEDSLEKLVKEDSIDEVLFINNMFAVNTEKIVDTINSLNK